ncbi:hypothetical protein M231_05368 [Tremella mesenterica]|uniref:Uncharacterized protein n=1 Tax=Tremella mesenterica TaxID=5217 RepID=A0A4Q1BIA9_TREME|nr:hypothetical protein M231_05368 [Tremella mesenterica]
MSSGNSDAAPPNVWSQWLVNTGRRVASTLGDILDDSGHASTRLSAPTTTPTEVGYVDNLLRSQGNSTAGLREYLEGKVRDIESHPPLVDPSQQALDEYASIKQGCLVTLRVLETLESNLYTLSTSLQVAAGFQVPPVPQFQFVPQGSQVSFGGPAPGTQGYY